MQLPVIATPKFELTLPSNGKKYKYRPFLVKEEKILLIALEGEDPNEIINAIKDIIDACIIGIKVSEMSVFDLEYVFLRLREKSISDVVNVIMRHPNNINTKNEECENNKEFVVKLSDVNIKFNKNNNKKIQLTDDIGIVMKYPGIDLIDEVMNFNMDNAFSIIQKCIDFIYDKENTYPINEYKEEDVQTFIESLTHNQMEKIEEFFATLPKMEYEIKWVCEKCGCEEKIILSGLNDFFM